MYLNLTRKLLITRQDAEKEILKFINTVLRGNKGQANKGQITFSKKIYSGRIRDKYWEKKFQSN